jgi:hypothetical protein
LFFGFPHSLTICVYFVNLSFGRGNDREWIASLALAMTEKYPKTYLTKLLFISYYYFLIILDISFINLFCF